MAGYGARYGYGSGYGYGVTGFVGILDRLSVQPYSFWSTVRRATSRWGGPVGRLYRTIDGVEIDIYGRGSLGLVDPNEIAAFAPTGNALWTKLYDQTGAGRHFEQATTTLMPYACKSGVPITENGIQSAEFVAADARRMVVPSSQSLYKFLHTTGGSIHSIARPNDTGALKNILGNKSGSTAAGIHWYLDTLERLTTDIGLIDVAGVATAGRSVGVTHQTASLANAHGVLVVDPDAPSAGDRGFIYRNDVVSSTPNAQTGTPFVTNAAGVLTLGSRENANNLPFDGTITEVAIWDSLIGSVDRGLLWSDASSLWGLA